ncbi:transcriptional regulator [Rhodococcus sp. IEGM 1401]|jgi:DNA-binding MarR family transcriptional regulator|uniref:Transcriptional regulator n=1 Tax=Rhodococcus cercidiphylli TaxID=489916 RepID=A0ABU4B4I4_9NOCA|nr:MULTISPECIES: transcriptional regulator [Rhodococcus]KAA0926314.1 winged helix DNA-binding protein [Rhodococcus sp. ANT_H53B]MCZ4560180.1 transcriptional regulator [Rhodococcus sp. IEGM 1401]MDI9920307.1 transcriptional regulator [Rhodococcus sp. IEGM 1372]MDI9924455.1 transcriptional regulator [Rhodococcus sp. IEGM 1341]MDV6233379.1 transcriptional regulator [Rhodococcus cercidiphylli]
MTSDLDPIIHPAHRLRICALLAAATTVELSIVKEHSGLSASALSKQVAALVDAGYVEQQRSRTDSRRLWLSLTKDGRTAYRRHVAALRTILADTDASI